jgi:magnesium transporter
MPAITESGSETGNETQRSLGASNYDERILDHVRRDMTTLRPDQTVEEAFQQLRCAQLAEKIVYFYVIDADGRLLGVVPTRRLLMSRPEQTIASIMVRDVVTIPASATVLEAGEVFARHRFLAFPVVDAAGKLLGVVDLTSFTEELLDLSQKQSIDDAFQLIGIHVVEARRRSAWASFKDRFPWLLCNIGGGLGCAVLAGLYDEFLKAFIVLALFIPVVLALAESVSIQSMTLTLQGLHSEKVSWQFISRSFRREIITASLLGLGSGFLVGLSAWLWKGEALVAVAIGGSICLSVITACLLGIALPTMLRLFRADPRIASGPIVLATADLATLLFFFNLSAVILRQLP